jgi:hypothetical protein
LKENHAPEAGSALLLASATLHLVALSPFSVAMGIPVLAHAGLKIFVFSPVGTADVPANADRQARAGLLALTLTS